MAKAPSASSSEGPTSQQTVIFSAILLIVTFLGIQTFKPFFLTSDNTKILGGFVSSLLFFFGAILVGNVAKKVGIVEVIFCLFLSVGVGATIHPICITTSFFFSLLGLFYLSYASRFRV
eukprot:TRINITY_DN621_c0_g1_i1.p1 TRINITY_DN621_c0_g1~~TRINITY_DN621_c0_g1_i1.p1  ORF type:complete len:119 (+),score=58.47 TRINITY_DN621_c0_g1_i1:58-414(+)